MANNGGAFDTAVTASAEGDSGKVGENITWELDADGTLTISGTGDMPQFGAMMETSPWYENTKIEKIVIKNGVTNVGPWAFGSCYELKSVEIPDTVTSIGDTAFGGCKSVKNVTIPENVNEIGEKAFGYTYIEELEDYDKYDMTITGYEDTAAEKYAKDNGFKFISLGKAEKHFALGDVNADGNIDVEDAVMVIGHVNGQKALTDDESKCADVDGNSDIVIEDAVAIIAHVNGVKPIE